MRAAIVYDCLFPHDTGGGERVYRAIAEDLVARGWEVDYLTRAGRDEPDALFRVLPIWTGEIHDARGIRTTASALRFGLAVRGALRPRRDDYDLVLASALPVLTLLGARAGLGHRRSARVLVGDWLEVWPLTTWTRYAGAVTGAIAWSLQRVGARAARRATVNSGFTARRLARLGRRLRVVVLGLVDLGGPPQPVVAAGTPPRVLAVGRLIPDKRIETLPAALAVVRRRIPEARLEVVGTGPQLETVRAASEAAGVADAVDLRGRVSEGDLDAALASAAVLAVPSRREGFGLVVAEAAARGVPAVVVDASDNAAAELVESGRNGILVRVEDGPGEADAVAAALVEAIEAGDALRASTAEWYREASERRSLGRSLDALLTSRGPGTEDSA